MAWAVVFVALRIYWAVGGPVDFGDQTDPIPLTTSSIAGWVSTVVVAAMFVAGLVGPLALGVAVRVCQPLRRCRNLLRGPSGTDRLETSHKPLLPTLRRLVSQSQQSPSGMAFDRGGPAGGIPIVLVHAGIADRTMWQPLWEDLTSVRDAVRLDLRGFGESTTRPSGPMSHVSDVLETLAHLNIADCHLVGSSLGSGVVTEVALTRPDLVKSLLLCPPGGSLLAELTPDLQQFFEAEKAALARDDLDTAVEANINFWVVGHGRSPSELDSAVAAAARRMQRNAFDVTTAWGDVTEVEMDPPALDRLSELAAPTMVLLGGHDRATTHDAARRVCAGAPAAQRLDWDEVAHLPSMEKPRPFLTLLLDWVASHE